MMNKLERDRLWVPIEFNEIEQTLENYGQLKFEKSYEALYGTKPKPQINEVKQFFWR